MVEGKPMVRRVAIIAVVAGAALILLGSGGSGSPGGGDGVTGPGPKTSLEPAPLGMVPRISEEDALRIAWREEGRSDATSVSAALAISRTSGEEGVKETPVWIVTYEGVCILAHGPPPGSNECAASTWAVTIDATTGEFLAAGT
jgi:hypothetical protein